MIRKKLHFNALATLCCAGAIGLFTQQQAMAQTVLPTHDSIGAKGSVTFNYRGNPVTYTIVRAADSVIWLQQNLGSSQVATANNDAQSYGDLFQWGRWDDGHQVRSPLSSTQQVTLSTIDPAGISPGNPNFLQPASSGDNWWNALVSSNIPTIGPNNTWSVEPSSATNGLDPCAALGPGWHMPDSTVWATVRTKENITSSATAYSSRLKLPYNGYRNPTGAANITSAGAAGGAFYWSSSLSGSVNGGYTGTNPWVVWGSSFSFSNAWVRGYGGGCRCYYVPLCDGMPAGGKVNTTKQSVCHSGSFTLSLEDVTRLTNIAYQWQERPHGSSDFTDIAGGDKTFLNVQNHQQTTEYRCKVTCTSTLDSTYSDTLAVAILSLPINLGRDTTICDGEALTLDAGVGGTDYEWSNGMTSRTITITDPDIYWAKISNSEGCIGSDTITVSMPGTPSGTAINATAYGLTYAFSVANALDVTTYEWTFGDGNTGSGPSPVHTYDTGGTYAVTVILGNDCDSNTISRQVTAVAPTTGISLSPESSPIKIFPVPARDVLHITADATIRIDDVYVFDINGKQLLRTGKPATGNIQINTAAWPSGIYLIKILSDKGSEMHRIVVE